MATGRCQGSYQIGVDGIESICGRRYGLKWGTGVAVDLGSLTGEAHVDPLFNVLSHPWPHHLPVDNAMHP